MTTPTENMGEVMHAPWAVKDDPLYPGEYYVMDADGYTVASGIIRPDRAHLIASAPTLLSERNALSAQNEALKAALEFYANNDNYCRVYVGGVLDDNDVKTFAPGLQDNG